MVNVQVFDYEMLIAFWLCFSRWTTIIFQIPSFDNAAVPGIVKILSSLVISYTFFPYTSASVIADLKYVGSENIIWITMAYVLIGLAIGYLLKSIMNIFIAGGTIISQQVGFGAMQYFDPTAGGRIGPFEKLMQLLIVVMIISSGALMPMFKGVVISFGSIRLMDLGAIGQSPEFFLKFFRSVFSSAILLASPLLFTNFLLYSIMGIVAKTIPQMNVLMVSFVVNIGIGLLVFIAISNDFFQVAYEMYVQQLGVWFQFIT